MSFLTFALFFTLLLSRCNYINFKRNMVCLKCDHKRPKAFNSSPLPSQSISGNMPNRRTRPFFGQEKQCREEGFDELKFVESQHNSSSFDDVSGFIDFPVIGGKSDLSQNVQRQDRWRREMAEQNRSASKAKENADLFKSSIIRAGREFLQSNEDDDEMAEWFGRKPNQNLGRLSET